MESQIVSQKQDLTMLSWAKARQSSGTAGSFLKSYDDSGPRKIYYKLSNYNPVNGIVGHECINEIVADRLLEILGIEHLSYQLIHGDFGNYVITCSTNSRAFCMLNFLSSHKHIFCL